MDSEEYFSQKEKYPNSTPIKVSSNLGAEFNAIVVIATKILVYPLKYMRSFWHSLDLDYDTDLSKEEFIKIINSSPNLTQQQLDVFKEIFDNEHSVGRFLGVTFIPNKLLAQLNKFTRGK